MLFKSWGQVLIRICWYACDLVYSAPNDALTLWILESSVLPDIYVYDLSSLLVMGLMMKTKCFNIWMLAYVVALIKSQEKKSSSACGSKNE
jgi:hypothetical protein